MSELRATISFRSDGITHYVPGLLAVIPTIYVPMINCARVIVEKKATILFLLKVSAYKLSKK